MRLAYGIAILLSSSKIRDRTVEDLAEALAEGLTTGHPGKPAFRFGAQDVEPVIDYLKSLEQ